MTSRRSRYDTIFGAFPSVIPGGTSDLYTKLVAYWKLEEASGTRDDAIGANDLTDNNTVTQQTGKIDSCAQFTTANSESLSIADNATLRMGDINFCTAAWVYADTLGTRAILAKWDGVAANEYRLRYNNSSGRMEIRCSSTGVDDNGCSVALTINTATWYYVMGWHDATNNLMGVSVNDTVNTVSYLLGVATGAAAFHIGSLSGGSSHWNGRIDEVALWKNYIPNSTERTWLYNSGSGRSFQNIYDYV